MGLEVGAAVIVEVAVGQEQLMAVLLFQDVAATDSAVVSKRAEMVTTVLISITVTMCRKQTARQEGNDDKSDQDANNRKSDEKGNGAEV